MALLDLVGKMYSKINFSYSGKHLSEIQTKLCLAWFIARDTVPHTTAHRYSEGVERKLNLPNPGRKLRII